MKLIRCQECGGEAVRRTEKAETLKAVQWNECADCPEQSEETCSGDVTRVNESWNKAQRYTRARKKFELVLKITGRPTESVVALLGPVKTKEPILEVIAEADAILDTLYGPLKGEGDG